MTHQIKLQVQKKLEVLAQLNISKTTLDNKIKEKTYVPPFSLGLRSVGFLSHETDIMIAAMAANTSKDDLKILVKRLIDERKSLFLGEMS